MQALVSALQQGGYVVVLRHGATNRDQADTDPLNFDNIAKQRVLSIQGSEQAKQLGDAFRTLQIRFGQVYTSKFNRAVETGRLATGLDVIVDIRPDGGRTGCDAHRKRPTCRSAAQVGRDATGAGHQYVDCHAQAEHSGCPWQGLV